MFNKKEKLNTLEVRTLLEYIKGGKMDRTESIKIVQDIEGCDFVGHDFHVPPTTALDYLNSKYKKEMELKGLYGKSVNEVYAKMRSIIDNKYLKEAK